MAEEIKKEETTQNPENVRPTKEQVDVVPLIQEGSTVNRLNDIFSKVERGQDMQEAITEVNKPTKPEQKKEEKQPGPAKQDEEVQKTQEETALEKKLKKEEGPADNTEEVTREKLRQENKKKEETPAPQEDDIPAEELQVLPYDKPKTAKRIQALLKKIDAVTQLEASTKSELQARDKKLEELQKQLEAAKSVDPSTNEKIKQQLDELAAFRRLYELEKDPEVKTKFDGRVEVAERSIKDLLQKKGAGEGLLKLIEDEGGWLKFAESTRVIQLKEGQTATAAELADQILQSLPLGDRKAIEAAMVDALNTKRDRERYIEEQKKSAADYFKKKDEEAGKQAEASKKQVEESIKAVEKWQKEVSEKEEFFKEKEVPADATKEQKAAIEEENKVAKQLKSLLKQSLGVKDLDGMLDIVLDSVRYYAANRQIAKLQSENEKLKTELKAKASEVDKVRSASRSTPKGGSIATNASSTTTAPQKVVGLEAAFDAIAKGEKLDRSGNVITANSEE